MFSVSNRCSDPLRNNTFFIKNKLHQTIKLGRQPTQIFEAKALFSFFTLLPQNLISASYVCGTKESLNGEKEWKL